MRHSKITGDSEPSILCAHCGAQSPSPTSICSSCGRPFAQQTGRFRVTRRTGVIATILLVVAAAGAVGAIRMSHAEPAAAKIYDQWSMTTTGDTVPSMIGTADLTLYGLWRPAAGAVDDAVEFYDKSTAYGIAEGSENDNPDTNDFALGVTFTSAPPDSGVGFSGNVVQKGRASQVGQVKISTLPTPRGGAAFCRVEGTNGYQLLKSKVVIDDGAYHSAVCWREGATIGLSVDGETVTLAWDPGSVSNDEPVRIGNQAAEGNWTDQHFGKNDCVVWVIGVGARELAESSTPC